MPFALLAHEYENTAGKNAVTEFVECFLRPNQVISRRAFRTMVVGQVFLFLLAWYAMPDVIPKPGEVLASLRDLFSNGLIADLYTSVVLYLEAVALATALSLGLAYASTIPFFRPAADMWSNLRFLGLVGLPFLFTLYLSGAHELKLALLTFSISVFIVTGMLDVIAAIPKDKFDLARTLRMGEWQVMWEVVILGRIDVAFDVVRQNAAIGWMMLCVVEGLFRSEGGIGTTLMTADKHFHLADIAAIQILFLVVGLTQDWLIGVIKNTVCPYATLLLERR